MKTEEIIYHHDDLTCRGFVAYPDSPNPSPAVLIAPSWAGRDQFVCDKATVLAEQGYIGFALDPYGDATVGKDKAENGALMTPLIEDRALLQGRMLAAYHAVSALDHVDSQNIAAMGYCFGGLCALDLARTNPSLKAAISLHGQLTAPDNISPDSIEPAILVLHGYEDPMIPPTQLLAFAEEMQRTQANWELCAYGKAMHAFTNPDANDPDFGTVYDAIADTRSWRHTLAFLAETLKA